MKDVLRHEQETRHSASSIPLGNGLDDGAAGALEEALEETRTLAQDVGNGILRWVKG